MFKGKVKGKKPIMLAVVGVVILAVLIILAVNIFGKDKTNYYSMWKSVLNNELGSYRFVVDVRTSEHIDGEDNKLQDSTFEDMQSVEGVSADAETAVVEEDKKDDSSGSNKTENSWTDSNGTTGDWWEYPNYRLIFEGCTTSVEPFTTNFTVTLATEHFNDTLTEVTIVDDKIYVDVESLQYWLSNSRDNYFISLGKSLPDSGKYMVLDQSDLKILSRYAEKGELESAYQDNALNAYRSIVGTISGVVDLVQNGLGNTGLSSTGDLYSLSLDGANADKLVGVVKNLAVKRGDVYDSFVNAQKSAGNITEEQYNQKVSEKDNFLAATDKMYRYLVSKDLSGLNLKVAGNGRTYVGGSESQNVEAELQVAFTLEGIDYNISLSGLRSGKGADITAPNGSTMNIDQQEFFGVVNGIFDYLNITSIDLGKQLEVTPDTIHRLLIEEFVDMVNNTSATESRISVQTAESFIQKYLNYKENEATTPDDVVNAQLVEDFLSSVDDLIVDMDMKTVQEEESEVEQFREVDVEADGLRFIAEMDEDNTSDKMGVIKLLILNTSNEEKVINLSDLNMRTMLESKYPINDETIIRGYDNTFDMSKLVKEVTLPAGGYIEADGYCIFNNGLEYMELYYGDKKLADIISR